MTLEIGSPFGKGKGQTQLYFNEFAVLFHFNKVLIIVLVMYEIDTHFFCIRITYLLTYSMEQSPS